MDCRCPECDRNIIFENDHQTGCEYDGQDFACTMTSYEYNLVCKQKRKLKKTLARYEKALREIASDDNDQVIPGYKANEIAREALGLPKLWSE